MLATSTRTSASLLTGLAGVIGSQEHDALPLGAALRHPLVATMAIGNALVFILSLASR